MLKLGAPGVLLRCAGHLLGTGASVRRTTGAVALSHGPSHSHGSGPLHESNSCTTKCKQQHTHSCAVVAAARLQLVTPKLWGSGQVEQSTGAPDHLMAVLLKWPGPKILCKRAVRASSARSPPRAGPPQHTARFAAVQRCAAVQQQLPRVLGHGGCTALCSIGPGTLQALHLPTRSAMHAGGLSLFFFSALQLQSPIWDLPRSSSHARVQRCTKIRVQKGSAQGATQTHATARHTRLRLPIRLSTNHL